MDIHIAFNSHALVTADTSAHVTVPWCSKDIQFHSSRSFLDDRQKRKTECISAASVW
ncbi:hypothetical protein NIES267_52320 [Calothrix parasitica NIES-267]|uniref:Uncharacterized protein n=1 Tax=Calothrix parasitica NIES-267 TaxID=1973488 RepID=A0A1Z4LX58_9CYAN|nr:hypothetical protein NIES267_52320 [Calothrix parasitica NIES-267]